MNDLALPLSRLPRVALVINTLGLGALVCGVAAIMGMSVAPAHVAGLLATVAGLAFLVAFGATLLGVLLGFFAWRRSEGSYDAWAAIACGGVTFSVLGGTLIVLGVTVASFRPRSGLF